MCLSLLVSKDLFSNQLIKLVVHCMLGKCVLTVQQFHELDLPEVSYIMFTGCLLYTSPSPRDRTRSRMPSSA